MSIQVRQACLDDVPAIRVIARQESFALGFFSRVMIEQAATQGSLLVAVREGEILGFVDFHHRKDHITTLYHIAVSRTARRHGIGTLLVEALRPIAQAAGSQEIRLKAIASIPANFFYQRKGFLLGDAVQGKRNLINIWHLPLRDGSK